MSASLRDRIRSRIAACRDDVVALTGALVAVPSANPPGAAYADCIGVLARHLEGLELDHTVVAVPSAPDRTATWPDGAPDPLECQPRRHPLRLTTKGRSAHVGLQHQGVNAFERMLDVAATLRVLKAEVECRVTAFAIEPEAARRSILLLGGQCGGGSGFNAVPADCWFTIDRRTNPEEDLRAEKACLLELLEQLKRDGIDLEVEVMQEAEASGSPADTALAQALARHVCALTGRRPPMTMCPGLLETRFYAQSGIPAYAYGPGLLEVAHGPQEWVSVDSLLTCATAYALTAVEMLGA